MCEITIIYLLTVTYYHSHNLKGLILMETVTDSIVQNKHVKCVY